MAWQKPFAWIGAGLVVGGVALLAWKTARKAEARTEEAFVQGVFAIPFASTRGDVDDGRLLPGVDPYGYRTEGDVPGIESGSVDEIMVVVHGLNNTETKGLNRFNLARESLRHNGYYGVVVGFSWDGSTNWDPFGATGYRVAKHNAMANGRKLAQFLTDLHEANPGANIRVIGYSMGARLVAEAVWCLSNDERFKDATWKLASAHIVGAAIDDEHLQTNDRYGTAIEARVGAFCNYFSPKDSKLGQFYPALEADRAVGKHDLEEPEFAPRNYFSHDVTNELLSVDSIGDIDATAERGTNHSAYLGIRNDTGKWLDDGVMDLVLWDIALRLMAQGRRPD